MLTLINYLLFLGVWPADLVFIANANVTAAGNGTGGAADDGTFVPGDPDYWLILYIVSFGIVCMTLLTNVRPPDKTHICMRCAGLHGMYRVRGSTRVECLIPGNARRCDDGVASILIPGADSQPAS